MASNNNKLKYSSLGFQMAITIGAGAWFGNYLDQKYTTEKPYYTILFVLIGIAIALYQVIKDVTNMTKEDEERDKQEK